MGLPAGENAVAQVFDLLADALGDAAELHPELIWCLEALAAPGVRVGAVAQELGWSRRRLFHRFTAFTGLAPKTYARIARFRRLVGVEQDDVGSGWSERAIAAGYFDQAHMIRDFVEFVGMTPTAFTKPA